MTDPHQLFPAGFFSRADESPDDRFYVPDRFVTHIDDRAIAAVGTLYRHLGLTGSVLDIMSSWVSHFLDRPDVMASYSVTLRANKAQYPVLLANGNLVVRGEKWLKLNQGDEFVRISGVIRPYDIATDNTVTSDRVADARISYGGKGAVQAASRMGWLARFFNSALAPF